MSTQYNDAKISLTASLIQFKIYLCLFPLPFEEEMLVLENEKQACKQVKT